MSCLRVLIALVVALPLAAAVQNFDLMIQQQVPQRDIDFRNQQEAGRGRMGQSSYVAPNGAVLQLPHTWKRDATYQYQGQTYGVDHAGQYHVLGAEGWGTG